MIWGISLIFLSVFAVPSLLLYKNPNASELLEKVEPYQGWIGIFFCIWALIGIVVMMASMDVLKTNPIWWITCLIGCSIQTLLGFMLGYGLINKIIKSGNPVSMKKQDEFRQKIAPKQGKLGIIGIIVGIWLVIADLLLNAS